MQKVSVRNQLNNLSRKEFKPDLKNLAFLVSSQRRLAGFYSFYII